MNRQFYSHQQRMVQEFHTAFDIYSGEWPHVPPEQIKRIRINLIREELEELETASQANDIVGVADALADLLYTINGGALAWGIGIEPIFIEVCRSNMTKSRAPMGADGKQVSKGPGYSRPNIEPLVEMQIPQEGSVFGRRR